MDRKHDTRASYPHFQIVPTRWMDNDAYGHVNNVVYYSYFDTVVNQYLIENGALDIENSPVIGLVVDTGCSYYAPVSFPDRVEAGLRVRGWAPAASATRSGCSATTTPPRRPAAISCMSTSTARRAARRRCRRRSARCSGGWSRRPKPPETPIR